MPPQRSPELDQRMHVVRTLVCFAALAVVGCRTAEKLSPEETIDGVSEAVLDGDGDGFWADEDCNDSDEAINGGAVEVCDGLDNDCDGEIDEDVLGVFYADADGDGFGDPDVSEEACDSPSGSVNNPNDCDDTNSDVYPGAAEVCDGIDNDCSGEIDEGVGGIWYADIDGDGYGDADVQTSECDPGDGWVQDDTDCDDNEPEAFPGNPEVCDDIDNNCDGTVDEGQQETYYQDLDGDGWRDPSVTTEGCVVPAGYAEAPGDCDEESALVFPGATEECDRIDNNCDGTVDEASAVGSITFYADRDSDGYGDASSTTTACAAPTGYVSDNSYCDDSLGSVNPGEDEICNGIDDDCDSVIDDLGPTALFAGSLTAGDSKTYQYSPVTSGAGYLYANWTDDPRADSYELAVGSTPGDDDVESWTDVGAVSSATLSGLTLDGAWDGAEYYVSIRPTNGSTACSTSATADVVQIAEAATWTGDVADLRAPDAYGGYTTD